MNEELTALAEAGAAAVVAAMATDVWQGTRSAVLALFQRTDRTGRADRARRAAIEAQLDGNAALVQRAVLPDADEIRRSLFGFWALELAALLRRDPSCREALARLAAEVAAALPDDRRTFTFEQTNIVHGSGSVFAVQHGDQHAYGTAPAEPSRDAEQR
ncbi:hypothetical protein OG709_12795 [Streptomyces sp. NBC_01267]|uniref:hypothetical protein n=1 Tax=Streptomyces sp. NBC_01267 TaxID=2903805 RepID=UPI002E376204|nr:hypothetical protein [Streptomyces sp. NBC_01267]